MTSDDEREGEPLWPARCLVDGAVVITREARPEKPLGDSRLQRRGDDWRLLRGWQQWAVFIGLFAPLQTFAAPWGVLFGVLSVVLLALTHTPPVAPGAVITPPAEARLAAVQTIEARVAGAACRAWAETIAERSWRSPFLASSRAAFDGRSEVDRIVDLALRIHRTRRHLGTRPRGSAGDYWDEQWAALDRAALQLGRRSDALIRYRDQAGDLSVELKYLADLERLERTSVEVDRLTVETAQATLPGYGDMGDVAAELVAVRRAMTDLLDLMTRTRSRLTEPPSATV
jgi:hypothetical protein